MSDADRCCKILNIKILSYSFRIVDNAKKLNQSALQKTRPSSLAAQHCLQRVRVVQRGDGWAAISASIANQTGDTVVALTPSPDKQKASRKLETAPKGVELPKFEGAQPLSVKVASYLRDAIMAGHLDQGMSLRENDFAVQLGVSRGPLREAFRILEAEGLVEIIPRKGVFVVRTSPEEEHEIYEVRSMIEGYGARLAAMRIDGGRLERMRELLEAMRGAARDGRYGDYQSISLEFHDTFMQCGQSKLYALYEQTRRFLLRVHAFKPGEHRIQPASIEEHARILEAIADRDPDRAEAAAREHAAGVHRRSQGKPQS